VFTCASAPCCFVVYFNWHRFGPDDSASTFIIAIECVFSRTACFRRACLLIRHNLKLFYHLLNKYYLAADFRYCSDFLFHGPLKYTCAGVIINCADTVEQTDGAHLKLRENFPDAMLLGTSLWQYSGTIFFPRAFTIVFVLVSNWLTGVIWRSLKRTIPVNKKVTPNTLPAWSAMMDSKLAPKCLKVQNKCAF